MLIIPQAPVEPIQPVAPRRWPRAITLILDALFIPALLYATACAVLKHVAQPARLRGLEASGSPETPDSAVWVTIDFRHYPPRGDPRDVRLLVSSRALEHAATFDWRWIAANAQEMAPNGMNRRRAPLPATEPPPLRAIDVRMPLPFRPRVDGVRRGEGLPVTVELYWAGTFQGETRGSANSLYYMTITNPAPASLPVRGL